MFKEGDVVVRTGPTDTFNRVIHGQWYIVKRVLRSANDEFIVELEGVVSTWEGRRFQKISDIVPADTTVEKLENENRELRKEIERLHTLNKEAGAEHQARLTRAHEARKRYFNAWKHEREQVQKSRMRHAKVTQLNEQLQSAQALLHKELDHTKALLNATQAEACTIRDELLRYKYRANIGTYGACDTEHRRLQGAITLLEATIERRDRQIKQLYEDLRTEKVRADKHKARYYKVVYGVRDIMRGDYE